MANGALEGKVIKKCSVQWHKPATNQGCKAGTCQHTCTAIEKCPHAWTLRYSVNGRQAEKSYKDDTDPATGRVKPGSGKRKAQEARLKLTHDKRAEGAAFADHGKSGKGNFGDAVAAYVASMALAPATRRSYESLVRKWVRPALGRLTLAQAAGSHDEVEALIAAMTTCAKSKRTARMLVTGTLDKAVATGKLGRHRVTAIEVEDDDAAKPQEFIYPTYEQVSYLADNIGLCVWLMRGCGLRICEALGVEKGDFRNGGRTLRVARQASRDGRGSGPLKARRAGEYRDVPVPTWLWRKVENLPDGPVCPGRGDRRYQAYQPTLNWFRKHVPAAGIDPSFHPHSLRHLFASVMLGQGEQITDVARWMGHRSINVTFAIYGHLLPDAPDRAIATLDAEFERWSQPDLKAA
jgi:integrase